MSATTRFALPPSKAGRSAWRTLAQSLTLEAESKERHRWTLYDSFDWRLLAAGFILLRDGRQWQLRRASDDAPLAKATLTGTANPGFASRFPVGELRALMAGPLDIRALMPHAEFVRETERRRVLNADGKTTVRLESETLTRPVKGKQRQALSRALVVVPLKGYAPFAASVTAQVAALGFNIEPAPRHYALAALEALGVQPGAYSSKVTLNFTPEVTAREACASILESSTEQMRANVPGLLADIDTEFLHDFRVALRRARSLLQLVRGVYPEKAVARQKERLGTIMRATNRLRDLDVYLLEREAYAALLPPALRTGLHAFFRDLETERARELQRFQRAFQGRSVQREREAWARFLTKEIRRAHPDCPDGDLPAGTLARRLLRKRFRRILRDGRAIDDHTPDEAVHRLRIQFKKLRYLLEFFRSLFDEAELDRFLKRSRKLQNVLGRFNDLSVQQHTITEKLARVDLERADAVPLCAALGALVAELERQRHATRQSFHRAFAALHDPRTLAAADRLFGETDPPPPMPSSDNPPFAVTPTEPKPPAKKSPPRVRRASTAT